MEAWSKGLRLRRLNLRFVEREVENLGETMVIKGLMGAPVWWEYTITMKVEDLLDVFIIAS